MSADAVAARVALPFRIGARTVGRMHRRLVRLSVPLEDAIAGRPPLLPGLPAQADGYFIRALPTEGSQQPSAGMRSFVRQSYSRHFADLRQDFETYLAGFSAKSRSSLKRKRRKLEERCGGALDVRLYKSPGEMEEFYHHARAVSALTYQERLLDAGLPEGALEEVGSLAQRDLVRGWLLFVEGRAVSYLYAPARGECLLYAHLGYDPAFADLSPGTVLQLEAMRMLMQERRFRWFDFTEGDGQHKRQFATGSIDSVDLLMLRPTPSNIAAARALNGFDRGVALAKRLAGRLDLQRIARAAGR
jgi:CelD/BcsL family acetyltransferase involved in cellulose biosynthesis